MNNELGQWITTAKFESSQYHLAINEEIAPIQMQFTVSGAHKNSSNASQSTIPSWQFDKTKVHTERGSNKVYRRIVSFSVQ